MPKIENYNCEGLCNEENCSERYTHFLPVKILGVVCHITLCEKHYEELQNFILKRLQGVKNVC